MASPGARLPYNSMCGSFMDVGYKDVAEKSTGFKHNRPLNFDSPFLTVPPGLRPSGLLNSPSFFCLSPQSPFGISHQQALAQVTAQASQSDRKNQVSVLVDKRAEDGYNWRKYGQKPIKGCEYPRSYYKCTYSNCPVKKKVERSADGHITEIIYKGVHNHDKPQPKKQTKGGCDGDANSQANPEFGGNGESTQAVEFPGSSDSEEGCDEESREERNDNRPNPKRRNTAGEATVMLSQKTVTEPKIILQTRSEVDLLDDGYRWRKYGQKVVKGNSHPRSYYKCTSAGCNVRKHVERASTDPKAVITTYEGKHNHDVPSTRNSSHNTVRSSLPQSKPEKVVADAENENHSLLKVIDFGNNGRGPAVLRLKEEQIRV
ncbi:putative WRKY transcription factor 58 [Hibiscus syriacus]|uniref:WRKY transcription factor 58 n=1 Tax=Hibiscus syriacus TaxID=106335 RepID=A0A6A2Y134_HIBSY|nr:putative WRKY transcription factor 58 [Hibiscus syriacus]